MNKTTYTVTTNAELMKMCIANNWFTEGTNGQYRKLFYANENGCPIEEIATMIWLCTDCEDYINKYGVQWCRRDILLELETARNKSREQPLQCNR